MKELYTADTWPETRWPQFSYDEMKCSFSGLCYIDPDMMDNLQDMRIEYGKGMRISSGYRHNTHPIEANKDVPGSHFTGKAVDVLCSGAEALYIVQLAMDFMFEGIGVKQHGNYPGRFIHIDSIGPEDNFHAPRPVLFSYPA